MISVQLGLSQVLFSRVFVDSYFHYFVQPTFNQRLTFLFSTILGNNITFSDERERQWRRDTLLVSA